MDGEAWKGGRRFSRTVRQWWTAAISNLDQVNSRIGAKKKRKVRKDKKTGAPSNTNNASDTWGYFPSKQQTPCESASPLCADFPMKKIIPVCQKNGNKQQIELGSFLPAFLFFFYLGGAGRGLQNLEVFWWAPSQTRTSAGNWVERGAAIFVKNREWVSEKPLQEIWGAFSMRKTETKTFSISSVKNSKGARQRGNESLNI